MKTLKLMSTGALTRSARYQNASDTQRHLALRDARNRLRNDESRYYVFDFLVYEIAWLAFTAPLCFFVPWYYLIPSVALVSLEFFPMPFLGPLDVRAIYRKRRMNFYVYGELDHAGEGPGS